MSKGGGSSTTVQKADPWTGLQPYLKDAYAQAQRLYQSGGPDVFPRGSYVPFSEQSNLGLDLLTNRALMGSQWDQPAGQLATNLMTNAHPYGLVSGMTMVPTARGDFLNANPYLDQMYNQAARQVGQNWQESVMPGINATFGASGRTGSGAHALTLGRSTGELSDSLASMAANVYGNNYQSERDRQLQAASALTGMGESDVRQRLLGAQLGLGMGQNEYADIQKLLSAGQAIEGKAGEIQGDLINRWDLYQNRPEMMLGNYTNWINGLPSGGGTTSSQTSDGGGSALGGAIGGGLVGSMVPGALSSMAAGGGMGAGLASGLSAIPGWGWMLGGALMGSGLLG